MSLRQIVVTFTLAVFVITIMGCAGSGKLFIDETYSELKPVKQLELPEQAEHNLAVTISNVADQSTSYKNRLELYINDRLIQPNWLVSNVQDTYTYEMKLKSGYYKVKAYYYAYVGWGDEKFQIEAKDLVRVTPTTRTMVTCAIAKKPNGVPVNEKMYFKVKSEPLMTPVNAENKDKVELDSTKIVRPALQKGKIKKVIRGWRRSQRY